MATAFQLPVWFDLAATFAFALTGALAAIKRGYDIVGLLSLAIVSGIDGGLIRDGVFLQQGVTPLLTNPHYLYVIGAAAVVGLVLGERVHHFNRVIALVDALGLGAYACFGVQKSLQVGLGKKSLLGGDVEDGHGGGALPLTWTDWSTRLAGRALKMSSLMPATRRVSVVRVTTARSR
ncbi:MAG: hypothetical protein RIS54_1444 [Verrucomicrobiota bacterium]|jgi:uncharacterized membrane protein YeiH